MKKLLLLDADIIIDLHTLGLFGNLSNAYQLYVTKKVFDEAKYYKKDGVKWRIDIKDRVTIVEDIDIENLKQVNEEARNAMLQIDSGEATSIAYLLQTDLDITFCICDKAAIQLVSFMDLDRKCISLEKALSAAGHHKSLYQKHLISSFKECIRKGKALRVQYKLDLI